MTGCVDLMDVVVMRGCGVGSFGIAVSVRLIGFVDVQDIAWPPSARVVL